MTTTSVKDVSTVMNVMAASVGNAAGAAAETSFQSVWNNQANKNPASEEAQSQVSGNKNTDPRDEVLKANETVRGLLGKVPFHYQPRSVIPVACSSAA